jgi:Rrf2 family transcriptional regulator, iron-sulfur cluster assembly transcription factor
VSVADVLAGELRPNSEKAARPMEIAAE